MTARTALMIYILLGGALICWIWAGLYRAECRAQSAEQNARDLKAEADSLRLWLSVEEQRSAERLRAMDRLASRLADGQTRKKAIPPARWIEWALSDPRTAEEDPRG